MSRYWQRLAAALAASGSPAFLCDLDGTLAEIVPTPEQVRVSPSIRRLLAELAQCLPLVAILSGRPAAQTHDLVGLDEIVYGGNHGLDWWCHGQHHLDPRAEPYRIRVKEAAAALAPHLAPLGVILEDRGVGLGLHYRLSPDPATARETILQVVRDTPATEGFRVAEGKRLVDLRPAIDATKGTALQSLLAKYRPQAAIYLGDDLTDLDAMAALREWGAQEGKATLAVVVGGAETPTALAAAADVELSGVREVERFLFWLLRNHPTPK